MDPIISIHGDRWCNRCLRWTRVRCQRHEVHNLGQDPGATPVELWSAARMKRYKSRYHAGPWNSTPLDAPLTLQWDNPPAVIMGAIPGQTMVAYRLTKEQAARPFKWPPGWGPRKWTLKGIAALVRRQQHPTKAMVRWWTYVYGDDPKSSFYIPRPDGIFVTVQDLTPLQVEVLRYLHPDALPPEGKENT